MTEYLYLIANIMLTRIFDRDQPYNRIDRFPHLIV
jgi:hypothetical protein